MSIHIAAPKGAIAEFVLLPGDPLRAQFVAERYLEEVSCYNRVRGMLGFTGRWRGRLVSVQGTGMGQPSLAIYATELVKEYGVKVLIRIGSCGSLQSDVRLRDIVIAMSASTDSAMNAAAFRGMSFAPTASYRLLRAAAAASERIGVTVHAGNILASDTFYNDEAPDGWRLWARYGVLAVEMESAALYTIAARNGIDALTILTVSDSLVTDESTSSQERENGFGRMAELALETLAELDPP